MDCAPAWTHWIKQACFLFDHRGRGFPANHGVAIKRNGRVSNLFPNFIIRMMAIAQLHYLSDHFNRGWGNSGYVTDKIYEVSIAEEPGQMSFQLQETESYYNKSYEIGPDQIIHFKEIIKKGHCFGAFENEELIGVLIGEIREWNYTFYIEILR